MRAVSRAKTVQSSESVQRDGRPLRRLPSRMYPAIVLALLLPAVAWAQVTLTIGDRQQVIATLGTKIVALDDYMEAPDLAKAKESGARIFEARTYRKLSVEWEKGAAVSVRLYGQMKDRSVKHEKFVVKDCGQLVVGETSWALGPDDLVCNNNFVDGAALIELQIDDAKGKAEFAYVRIYNRKFPMAGSDAGIVLTLTERLKSSDDSDEGFSSTNGLSVYYAVSRLKSQQWRGIVHVAALDQLKDEKDLEVGLGFGVLFRSNGFLDTNTGLSLAGGMGYNLMVPDSSERWYWFVGLGTNFDLGKKE